MAHFVQRFIQKPEKFNITAPESTASAPKSRLLTPDNVDQLQTRCKQKKCGFSRGPAAPTLLGRFTAERSIDSTPSATKPRRAWLSMFPGAAVRRCAKRAEAAARQEVPS